MYRVLDSGWSVGILTVNIFVSGVWIHVVGWYAGGLYLCNVCCDKYDVYLCIGCCYNIDGFVYAWRVVLYRMVVSLWWVVLLFVGISVSCVCYHLWVGICVVGWNTCCA